MNNIRDQWKVLKERINLIYKKSSIKLRRASHGYVVIKYGVVVGFVFLGCLFINFEMKPPVKRFPGFNKRWLIFKAKLKSQNRNSELQSLFKLLNCSRSVCC